MKVGVLMAGHEGARVVGSEDQLGIDAVFLHLLDPGHRVVAHRIDVLVAAPRTHVGGITAGRRPPAEGQGHVVTREHPPVPIGQAVHPRDPIAVLGGHAGHLIQDGEAAVDLFPRSAVVLDGAGEILAKTTVEEVVVASDVETGFCKEIRKVLFQVLVDVLKTGPRFAVCGRFAFLH